MARGNKQIPGQMTLEMCVNRSNYVVQANDLIGGKQALGLNSAKLIRAAVMQIKPEDDEIQPYMITIKQLADILEVSPANLYRDIDEITNDIIEHPVFIKNKNVKKGKTEWVKIPWVEFCQYNSDIGVSIQLNNRLKPFLIALKEHYTQYRLEEIMVMKSVYAIRIFELLQSKIFMKTLPREGLHVIISIEEIREACDLGDKYTTIGNLKNRVLDIAVKEINRVTMYAIEYSNVKKGRFVEAIDFNVNMQYHLPVYKQIGEMV